MEYLDATDLSNRTKLPKTWIQTQTRSRTATNKQIPHLKFGKYVRFDWDAPELHAWLKSHAKGAWQK